MLFSAALSQGDDGDGDGDGDRADVSTALLIFHWVMGYWVLGRYEVRESSYTEYW